MSTLFVEGKASQSTSLLHKARRRGNYTSFFDVTDAEGIFSISEPSKVDFEKLMIERFSCYVPATLRLDAMLETIANRSFPILFGLGWQTEDRGSEMGGFSGVSEGGWVLQFWAGLEANSIAFEYF